VPPVHTTPKTCFSPQIFPSLASTNQLAGWLVLSSRIHRSRTGTLNYVHFKLASSWREAAARSHFDWSLRAVCPEHR
jgi:hypothetical protein